MDWKIRIQKLEVMQDELPALLDEYYEAVHVVLRDQPSHIESLLNESSSGIWLAYLGEEAAGCVVLRRLHNIPHAAECKRLYVKPSARGHRIADKLLDALERFALSQGTEWIYLDTYDDLKTAIALYERRGYLRCDRYNNNPQATIFLRKKLC